VALVILKGVMLAATGNRLRDFMAQALPPMLAFPPLADKSPAQGCGPGGEPPEFSGPRNLAVTSGRRP